MYFIPVVIENLEVQTIEKNNNTPTVQAESSKFVSLSFDHGLKIVIPPRIVAIVPEPIETPSDGILHQSNCCLFRHYIKIRMLLQKAHPIPLCSVQMRSLNIMTLV